MLTSLLRKTVARLPLSWQSELRRLHFRRLIRRGTFGSDEPEYAMLDGMVRNGDWVIDVGANVGFYAKKLSELVGTTGRVLAFEPVPETFALLANNLDICGIRNVTLFNAAVSDGMRAVGMSIPDFADTGQRNYYQAHLAEPADSELSVLTMSIDSLGIPEKVVLIKIDAEGHEYSVLKGMVELLRRDHPALIVETGKQEVWDLLAKLGYSGKRRTDSPNVIFEAPIGVSKGRSTLTA